MPLHAEFLPFSFIFQTFTVYMADKNWQSSSVECKLKHKSYLFGDVDVTDPEQACALI